MHIERKYLYPIQSPGISPLYLLQSPAFPHSIYFNPRHFPALFISIPGISPLYLLQSPAFPRSIYLNPRHFPTLFTSIPGISPLYLLQSPAFSRYIYFNPRHFRVFLKANFLLLLNFAFWLQSHLILKRLIIYIYFTGKLREFYVTESFQDQFCLQNIQSAGMVEETRG